MHFFASILNPTNSESLIYYKRIMAVFVSIFVQLLFLSRAVKLLGGYFLISKQWRIAKGAYICLWNSGEQSINYLIFIIRLVIFLNPQIFIYWFCDMKLDLFNVRGRQQKKIYEKKARLKEIVVINFLIRHNVELKRTW